MDTLPTEILHHLLEFAFSANNFQERETCMLVCAEWRYFANEKIQYNKCIKNQLMNSARLSTFKFATRVMDIWWLGLQNYLRSVGHDCAVYNQLYHNRVHIKLMTANGCEYEAFDDQVTPGLYIFGIADTHYMTAWSAPNYMVHIRFMPKSLDKVVPKKYKFTNRLVDLLKHIFQYMNRS